MDRVCACLWEIFNVFGKIRLIVKQNTFYRALAWLSFLPIVQAKDQKTLIVFLGFSPPLLHRLSVLLTGRCRLRRWDLLALWRGNDLASPITQKTPDQKNYPHYWRLTHWAAEGGVGRERQTATGEGGRRREIKRRHEKRKLDKFSQDGWADSRICATQGHWQR